MISPFRLNASAACIYRYIVVTNEVIASSTTKVGTRRTRLTVLTTKFSRQMSKCAMPYACRCSTANVNQDGQVNSMIDFVSIWHTHLVSHFRMISATSQTEDELLKQTLDILLSQDSPEWVGFECVRYARSLNQFICVARAYEALCYLPLP